MGTGCPASLESSDFDLKHEGARLDFALKPGSLVFHTHTHTHTHNLGIEELEDVVMAFISSVVRCTCAIVVAPL